MDRAYFVEGNEAEMMVSNNKRNEIINFVRSNDLSKSAISEFVNNFVDEFKKERYTQNPRFGSIFYGFVRVHMRDALIAVAGFTALNRWGMWTDIEQIINYEKRKNWKEAIATNLQKISDDTIADRVIGGIQTAYRLAVETLKKENGVA